MAAPKGTVKSVPISGKAAQALAYYGSALDLGVLAPRGWHCRGRLGSGGAFLYVTDPSSSGPAIEISERHSDQNGDRDEKAQIIRRAFPAFKELAAKIMEGFEDTANDSRFGPYPADKLTYKSDRVVEYRTPAWMAGLGTHSSLKKNGSPIEGVVILSGNLTPPDLILLSVRLPKQLAGIPLGSSRFVPSLQPGACQAELSTLPN